MEVRGQTISFSSHRKKQNDKKERQLAEEILKLEQNLTEDKMVLNYFNFGPCIIQWILTFYENTQVTINQGGNLSSFF